MVKQQRAASSDASKDLPSPRKGKTALRRDVSPPLSRTSLPTVVYALFVGVVFFLAWCIYFVKMRKIDTGGWTNFPFAGPFPASSRSRGPSSPGDSEASIEARIRDLAEQLGVHPKELALAIKPLISHEKATIIDNVDNVQAGTLVDVIAESLTASHPESTSLGLGHAALSMIF